MYHQIMYKLNTSNIIHKKKCVFLKNKNSHRIYVFESHHSKCKVCFKNEKEKQCFICFDDNVSIDSLDSLFYHYGSDKADIFKKTENKGHGYSKFYKQKLEILKNEKINILEIGSFAGASAAAFAKYLPKSNIFCFDISDLIV